MTNPLAHAITEDDIVHYLAHTPDFFERQAELLAAVQLSSPHSDRAVSLQERQATLLRDKIKLLEGRNLDMIRHGNENTVLSDKLTQWVRALFLAPDPMALPSLIASEIETLFGVPQVAIKVWGVSSAFAPADFAQGVNADALRFAASLAEPYCGANKGFEVVSWLSEPLQAKSLAILPLRGGPNSSVCGLLVLASPDVQRYNSTMGTDFLTRLAELASAALSPLTRE